MLNAQIDNESDRYKNRVERFSGTIDIGLFFHLFYKSRFFIFLFFGVSCTIGFLYLRYSQQIFESKTVVQINDKNDATQILQISQMDGNSNKIAEATEQIRSRIFLKRVVDRLEIECSYFNEGTFKSNELYMGSPYFVKINIKNSELYNKNMYITFVNGASGGFIQYTSGGVIKKVQLVTGS